MLASAGSSPPRAASPTDSTIDATAIVTVGIAQPQPVNRKRKHRDTTQAASSPAPSDANGHANSTENVVLSARNDLFARPRLTISRGPVLVPISDGSVFHTTEQIALNKIGFRYTPAGIAPLGSTLPCRTIESNPTYFRVSWEDRSPLVKVTKDGLGLMGDKGFRSARCNAPFREGRWYMEVKIEHGGGDPPDDNGRREGSHVRLGWGRRQAPLNGPIGLDGYSYGIRDKTGEKVTLSRLRPYGRGFSTGDVVGMYISLPPRRKATENDPHDPAHVKREHIPIDFKGQEYFESLEYPASKEMISLLDHPSKYSNSSSLPSSSKKSATVKNLPKHGRGSQTILEVNPLRPLPTLPDSMIAFFINGECQGIAFTDVYDYLQLRTKESSRKSKEKKRSREGTLEHKENPFDDGSLGYYPFISLFNYARVRLNPGPDFAYPPPPDIDAVLKGTCNSNERTWRPASERYPEYMAEQWALDVKEEEEAKVDAVHRAALDKAEAAKKIQREKRRQQALARKIVKRSAGEYQREPSAMAFDDIPMTLSFASVPPNSLKIELCDQIHSPAPTIASSVDIQHLQSGYNSDYVEGEADDAHDGGETQIMPGIH
jgi:COMPASS component BRE2